MAEIMQQILDVQLQSPQALFILPIAWLLLVIFAWRRRFRPFGPFLLRLLIIILITLALSQPTLPTAESEIIEPEQPVVILVDQSASLGQAGQQALRSEAAQLTRLNPNAQTLFFAGRPVLVDDPALAPANAPDNAARGLDVEVSNLAEALSLGAEFLNDQPGRLVLLSDGVATTGDALEAAAQLAEQEISIDVLLPTRENLQSWRGDQIDAQVVQLAVPPVLRAGETFDVEVVIYSEAATEVNLSLRQNDQILAEDLVALDAGSNRFTFTAAADEIGPQTFRAALAADNDRQPENNSFSAFAQVFPPPRILIVAEDLEQSSQFVALLTNAGFETQTIQPVNLPDSLSALEPFAGMVLLNVPAGSFELEQMLAIQEFVRSLGRGLVVTGGRNSFSFGDYDDTPLAELLPLSLEPPPREERPPVALLLIIDHSGSMVEQTRTATRLAMAKEAAIRATDILGPDDLLGVFIFDNRFEWIVPFQQINDGAELLEIQQRIARIPPGGGTRILQAMEAALPALIDLDTASARHVVLLTDGKSFDGTRGIEDYNLIVDQAREVNITLSTIAIGVGADVALLEHLADRGKGRYHFAESPEALPALTISESDILRSNALQEGDFEVAIFQPHPLLRGLFSPLPSAEGGAGPGLNGYLAMTPKPRSEVALQVGPGDPLLSVWGYGLGRVVAWSSDIGGEWATAWQAWPEFGRFWGQVIGYTLPSPDLGLLQLDAAVEADDTVVLIAESFSAAGQPIDRVRTQASLLTPGGEETRLSLPQVAPGRYEGRLRLPDDGVYRFTVTQPRPDDEPAESATLGFVLPYPAEYARPAEDTGVTLLDQIARTTGGRAFGLGEISRIAGAAPESPAEAEPESYDLWPWLLLAALLLWPLEIAWRRWGRLRIQ